MRKTLLIVALLLFPRIASSTVTTTTRDVTYTGSGGKTFTVTFPFLATSHLVVTQITIASGAESVLTEGVDYTVSRTGLTGGTVTTTVAITSSYQIQIERVVPVTQPTAFRTQGRYSPRTHEDSFDRLTMIIQQLSDIAQSSESLAAINAHVASSDDHTAYFKLAGRAGGQTANGGTANSENLVLHSTAGATKGLIYLGTTYYDEVTDIFYSTNDIVVADDLAVGGNITVDGWLYGGDGSGDNIVIQGSSDATKGGIYLGASPMCYIDETNSRMGLGTTTPTVEFHNTGDAIVEGTISGDWVPGGDLTLESTTDATKGNIYLGTASTYDEVNDRLGIGTLTPAFDVDVVGNVAVSGYVTGGDGASDSLTLTTTTDPTKGYIYFGTQTGMIWDETNQRLYIGLGIGGPSADVRIKNSHATNRTLSVHNGEGTSSAVPLKLIGGKAAPAQAQGAGSNGDSVWVELQNGDSVAMSYIDYTTANPYARFVAASDARMKTNIKPTDLEGLWTINHLPVRQFDWKEEYGGAHEDVGFVAQEVEDIYPVLVSKMPNSDMKTVGPSVLVTVLVKAVQELSVQVEAQQRELDYMYEIRTELDELRALVEEMRP